MKNLHLLLFGVLIGFSAVFAGCVQCTTDEDCMEKNEGNVCSEGVCMYVQEPYPEDLPCGAVSGECPAGYECVNDTCVEIHPDDGEIPVDDIGEIASPPPEHSVEPISGDFSCNWGVAEGVADTETEDEFAAQWDIKSDRDITLNFFDPYENQSQTFEAIVVNKETGEVVADFFVSNQSKQKPLPPGEYTVKIKAIGGLAAWKCEW